MSAKTDRKTEEEPSAPTSVQPTHTPGPQDANKTHNHTDQVRVLEMNIKGKQAERHPETVAGQHATGSFTGENEKKKK